MPAHQHTASSTHRTFQETPQSTLAYQPHNAAQSATQAHISAAPHAACDNVRQLLVPDVVKQSVTACYDDVPRLQCCVVQQGSLRGVCHWDDVRTRQLEWKVESVLLNLREEKEGGAVRTGNHFYNSWVARPS